MPSVIEVRGLHMRYGSVVALNGASMAVPEGRIVGLLGPNGSGKTTLLKAMAGLLHPREGEIIYPDNARQGPDSRGMLALAPDEMTFPHWMRVRDAFDFYRDMYPDYSQERAGELCGILELGGLMQSKIRRLSKGMKERLTLGLTFSRKTRLYLLDEPLGGIDPVGKLKVIDAILSMPLEGSSILISTHLVKDIERIFDSAVFLSKGSVVFSGDCDDMREKNGKTVEQAYLEVFIREGSL